MCRLRSFVGVVLELGWCQGSEVYSLDGMVFCVLVQVIGSPELLHFVETDGEQVMVSFFGGGLIMPRLCFEVVRSSFTLLF